MGDIELKTCPFCNGEYQITNNYSGIYWGICLSCGMLTPQFKSEEEVIKFINYRKSIANIVEQLEAIIPFCPTERYSEGAESALLDAIDVVGKSGVK